MATGKSGYFDVTKNGFTARVKWSETYDIDTNTSVISIDSVQIKSANTSGITYWLNGPVSVDGNAAVTFKSGAGSHAVNVKYRNTFFAAYGEPAAPWPSAPIEHDTDGSKSVTISIDVYLAHNTNPGAKLTGSITVELTTIPRASAIAATNANIGSNTAIAITRASSGFTHTLTYAFGELTGTISENTSDTSILWEVPAAFYDEIPNAKSGKCTLTCVTYSGSTQIGSSTCDFTATASESVCKPTLSPTAVDANDVTVDLTGDSSKFVRYFSTAQLATGAKAQNGANLVSQKITCGTQVFNSATATVKNVETATFVFSATDSRGYTTTQTVTAPTVTMVDYVKLSCVFKKVKTTVNGDVTLNISGNYFNSTFGKKSNVLTVYYRYKTKGGDYCDDIEIKNVAKDGNTYSATFSVSNLNYQETYTFQVCVSDELMMYDGYDMIVRITPVFDWGENDFQFNVPVNLPRSVYKSSGSCGINMNNSDIVGFNAMYGSDEATDPREGINFYRDGTNWDAIWANGGNIFFCPNYPENTTAHSLFYAAGDKISLASQGSAFAGFLTDSAKRITFTIPLRKPIIASGVSISGTVVARGIAGYIAGTSAAEALIDLGVADDYTASFSISDTGINVKVEFGSSIINATNNTPVTVTPYGTLEITFS